MRPLALLVLACVPVSALQAAPKIRTSNPLPEGTAGSAYLVRLDATGGAFPYTWRVTSGNLPPGLTLASSGLLGGVLSGVPTAADTYNFRVQVEDARSDRDSKNFTLTVRPVLAISTPSALPGATAGAFYSVTLSASGGSPPYRWSLAGGTLPPGLSLSAAGVLGGTPTAAGNFSFAVEVKDNASAADTRGFTISVAAALAIITPSPLLGGTVGGLYSQSFTATGGSPPYVWSVVSGPIPAGLSLSSGGLLRGTPTVAGTYNFVVQAKDAASTATRNYALNISPPLAIVTPSPLPGGTAGVGYSLNFSATGGRTPYTWSVASGALPAGLTLSQTGALSGTPSAAGTHNFTAEVRDAASNTASRNYSLTITAALAIVTPSPLPGGAVSIAYSQSLQATGGTPPYAWSVSNGSLPAGLALSQAGVLSGTPASAGTVNFTAQVTDSASRTAAQGYLLTIVPALAITTLATLPSGTVNVPYSFTLAASGGTPPYSWSVASGTPPPGVSLGPGGVLAGTPTSAGTYSFTVQVGDGISTATRSCTLVVNAALAITTPSPLAAGAQNAAYSQALAATGGAAPYAWSVIAGNLPPGLGLSPEGTLSGTPTAAGSHNFTIQVSDAASATATQSYSLTVYAALAIATSSLPDSTVNVAYSQTLAAGGGASPLTWSVAGGNLPAGIGLSPAGVLSGTPATAGAYTFTVEVTDGGSQKASQTFSITIRAALAIASPSSLPLGTVGVPYRQSLTASGGAAPYNWSVTGGAMPAGLTLSASGLLSGVPSAAGFQSFTVTVTDASAQTAAKTIALTISNPAIVVSAGSLAAAYLGAAYSQTLTATGGTPPYTWAVAGGSLPPGLRLTAAGILSGMPAAPGTYRFTVRATDSGSDSATGEFSVTVRAPLSITTPQTLNSGALGTPYALTLTASGGEPPHSWSITSGALPSGLVLDGTTGAITGTPGMAGTYNFTARVADAASGQDSRAFSITVSAGLTIVTAPQLSGASVGAAYSQALSAAGGSQPYTWSITEGALPGGLAVAASSGVISGNPAGAGSFTFTIRVTDAVARAATKQFTLSVAPALVITNAPELPPATLNSAYSHLLAGTGGYSPYSWSITAGALPAGLSLDGVTGEIRGTATAAGSFAFTVTVTDSSSVAASKQFLLTASAGLVFSTEAALPGGTVGVAYRYTLAASGGKPPYRWSVASGAPPPGISLDSITGEVTGAAEAPGTYEFTVSVSDSAEVNVRLLHVLRMSMPEPPALDVSGIADPVASLDQPPLRLRLASPYPFDITGRLTLTFEPDAEVPADDPSIQLLSGGRTATFTIPAHSAEAGFPSGLMALQTGTVAGTIRLSAKLTSMNSDLTPQEVVVRTVKVSRSSPTIRSVHLSRTASGIEVRITGFSNTREMKQAGFRFAAASGGTLNTIEVTVPLADLASTWFREPRSAQFGSQFELVQPFSVQGSVDAVGSVSVTLTNSIGSSEPATGSF